MSVAPSRVIFDSLFRGKAPGLSEFGALLQFIDSPSVLVYIQKGIITSVNSSMLALTAYPQADLYGKPISILFDTSLDRTLLSGGDCVLNVNRNKRTPIAIRSRITILDPNNNWALITLSPTAESGQEVNGSDAVLIHFLMELILCDRIDNIDLALEQKIKLIEDLLRSSAVCIYQAGSGSPELIKLKTRETKPIFPESLPSNDLVQLREPFIWDQGKKALTSLHQKCRNEGLVYAASCAIGEKEALSGLIVVGDYINEPPAQVLSILRLVATSIGSSLQHFIKIRNIQDAMIRQQRLLDIYSNGLENVKEGIIVLRPDLTIMEINPTTEWMLGYTENEVKGQPAENLLIGTDRLIPALESAKQNIPTHNMGAITLNRRNGQSFPAQMQIIPIQKDDKLLAIMVFVSDVSEHEQIQVRTQQLEHRALLGDFTNVFAHEVRNPINNISTGIQLLASRLPADDPNRDVVERVQNDCLRLNSLMESVLAFSRPVPRHFGPIDLNVMLKQMLDRWYPRMTKVNVKSFFQENANIPNIEGDWRSLEQVFTNLISNAVEAMEKNGGTLAIQLDEVSIPGGQKEVQIKVTDTGPGIPDEVKSRLFEPFVTNKPNGTGLGLAIIKRIIIAHRGSIDVDSFPGGTVFRVNLPAYIGD